MLGLFGIWAILYFPLLAVVLYAWTWVGQWRDYRRAVVAGAPRSLFTFAVQGGVRRWLIGNLMFPLILLGFIQFLALILLMASYDNADHDARRGARPRAGDAPGGCVARDLPNIDAPPLPPAGVNATRAAPAPNTQ